MMTWRPFFKSQPTGLPIKGRGINSNLGNVREFQVVFKGSFFVGNSVVTYTSLFYSVSNVLTNNRGRSKARFLRPYPL